MQTEGYLDAQRRVMPAQDGDDQGFDLAGLVGAFTHVARRMWWLALISCALGVGVMYAVSYFNYTPLYRCEATFTITSGDGSSLYSSISSASQLSKTFPYILDSEYFRSVLREELGESSLNGSLEAQTIDNSNMATMWVDSPSAEDARAILEKALEVYPEVSRFVLGDIEFSLIDEVTTPTEPINVPSTRRIVGYGIFGGLCVTVLVIGLLVLFNNTIKTPEDMGRISSMPCLGALPEARLKARKKRSVPRLISALNPRATHGFRESARSMGVRVADVLVKREAKVVLVTSGGLDEGKTTVAVNLAEQLAKDGARVLLVDADLRTQRDAALLGVEGSTGLVELLDNTAPRREDCLVWLEESGIGFWGGSIPAKHPAETLSDKRLPSIFKQLKKDWDYIVLDAPPSGMFQDAALIAEWVDAVLLVVRFDGVSSRMVREALTMLEGVRASLIGYVLNACPQSESGYGYGLYGYGAGRYGYGSYGKSYSAKAAAASDDKDQESSDGLTDLWEEDSVTAGPSVGKHGVRRTGHQGRHGRA